MAKVEYNEILPKRTVIMDGDPYVVLSSSISKKDRQKASNAVKMKNLRTGGVVDRTFHQADVLEEAELEKRPITFIYENKGEYWFHKPGDPSKRFSLSSDLIGSPGKFMKSKNDVEALVYNEEVIGVNVPIKVELVVKEAMPAVKGNTSSGATKEVTLETGAVVMVPMFINQGDVVSINTETGSYAERIEKA